MSCKFKEKKAGCTRSCCKATNGECQYENTPYDSDCEILEAFKDLDPNSVETSD